MPRLASPRRARALQVVLTCLRVPLHFLSSTTDVNSKNSGHAAKKIFDSKKKKHHSNIFQNEFRTPVFTCFQ